MIIRKKTKEIRIGTVKIGAGNPVSVQSMTKTHTADIAATVTQIKQLEEAGCQIIRVAVKDETDALALRKIKESISIPLVADIHFDHRLALIAIEAGIDKLRINPGNIGDEDRIKVVVSAAKARKVPIRIGVNSGSLQKDILAKYGHPCPKALVESALVHIKILERLKFYDIVLSIKSADVVDTIESYELLSKKVNFPLHVGITEAGIPGPGNIKSAVGIGAILARGIGDTIRVSLTGDPVEEVKTAYQILRALGLYNKGVTIISCPTCGRLEYNMEQVVREITEKTRHIEKPLKIAIMGCVVNGPGEACEADLGLAGGRGQGIIFKNGAQLKKVPEKDMVSELLKEIYSLAK
ncbi:MAG: flavodoxin-dependent (E)-4-hydroxy-3-methylbut-2-enyl-diphosphate synthase [Candidatus Margulisiibacteriota bacterium]